MPQALTLGRQWDVGLLYHWADRRPIGRGLVNDALTQSFYLVIGRSY